MAVREKPLVSLSVGMSALLVVLVLIMLLGVCHRNAPDNSSSASGNRSTTAQRQRQRQAAARRRARARSRRQNENHTSIGTQADVDPSDRLFILPRPEFTRRAETVGGRCRFLTKRSEALKTLVFAFNLSVRTCHFTSG